MPRISLMALFGLSVLCSGCHWCGNETSWFHKNYVPYTSNGSIAGTQADCGCSSAAGQTIVQTPAVMMMVPQTGAPMMAPQIVPVMTAPAAKTMPTANYEPMPATPVSVN